MTKSNESAAQSNTVSTGNGDNYSGISVENSKNTAIGPGAKATSVKHSELENKERTKTIFQRCLDLIKKLPLVARILALLSQRS